MKDFRSMERSFHKAINKLPKQKSYNLEMPDRKTRQQEQREYQEAQKVLEMKRIRESIKADIKRIHEGSKKDELFVDNGSKVEVKVICPINPKAE